ncbi:GDSL-type esterase/lipase family protein [Phenylobacterium sp. J367]|uniref:GDSL-type esterase/lipase family protein n=1 Tax=Phenylobacterium sp. J367 TaxID=2898435 RepID=UPI002150BFB5|nr:GDSL-type esterase/lipase family protein [Phenylobacterium sp. J367]MCR5878019.1 GDSL-type esterase/lipase family protein [Phenylobacterium sp. J367]
MRLLAFGDSFVLGQGDPDHLGWIGRALLGRSEVTLYNLGVRGDTSADIVRRWRAEAEARLRPGECAFVFSFGANDSALEGGSPRVAPAQTLLNARSLLTEAGKLGPVLLVGPPPMPDPGICARLEALNEHLKALAGRLQVPFIDVFRPLFADGLWNREAETIDGAHPGAGGYGRMADLVAAHPAWRTFTGMS